MLILFCFLQTVPWFRFNPDELYGVIYTNVDEMVSGLEEWLADCTPKILILGELQDGLAFDPAFKRQTGKQLTHWIIPMFSEQDTHRLIFLSKSTLIRYALELPPTPQVVFSWSVNAEYVGRKWEHGTPLPSKRFEAARIMRGSDGLFDSACIRWCLTRAGDRDMPRRSTRSMSLSRKW